MRAVIVSKPGGVEELSMAERPAPSFGPEEILVRNFATALNRADLLQRRGLYPPPAGVTDILGLEFAGEVAEAGAAVHGLARGDRVFGLVAGGGYAEFVAVHHRLALPIPDHLSFDAAASVPEAFITAGEGLFHLGRLAAGGVAVIHAGASGVGSAAIQLARACGAAVVATVSSRAKAEQCLGWGAVRAVVHGEESFREAVRSVSAGRGADVVLDLVGARHWEESIECLGEGGRLIVVGLVGGSKAPLDLARVLFRRLEIRGTALRARPLADKIAMADRFREHALPLLERGVVRAVIDRVYPLDEVRDAHARMEANLNSGKIVLRM